MGKNKGIKAILTPLLISALLVSGGGFYFFENSPQAQAAKKTKWQKLLEKNGVSEDLWSKYLPKVSRGEYNKVTKGKTVASAKKSKSTKWQKLLERNGVDQSLWQKYLPKVSRKEYKKAIKALQKLSGASSGSLGPDIRIGIFSLNQDLESGDRTVELRSIKGNYLIKYNNGSSRSVSESGSSGIKVNKNEDTFEIRSETANFDIEAGKKVIVESSDSDGIIEIVSCEDKKSVQSEKYDTDGNGNRFAVGCYEGYNKFRGKIELSFDDNGTPWVINELPIEQYTWGTGEIGDLKYEYYKLFSIVFRTYGYRNLEHKKTAHKDHNFDLSDTSSDQIYKGYKIEERYANMKKATQETRGSLITYKGEAALTPYCSWSDGRTRDYNTDDYPYLEGRKDKYGKHPSKSTKELKDDGNHMYGLIANGARKMIDKGKSYKDAINYYYKGVKIEGAY